MKLNLVLICLLVAPYLSAQTAEDSVKQTVKNMFIAMQNSDVQLMKTCFTDSAILQTIAKDSKGQSIIKNEKLNQFISIIGSMPKGMADERIQNEEIRIDGPMAIVWAPYHFYLNGKFSHCGVNSFQLVRVGDSWKINYLIDTRRKQPCL